MHEQLSQVYALMFQFYRDAIAWYLSSSRSKFFGSFNDKIKSGLTKSLQTIKDIINRMINLCQIGNAAMSHSLLKNTAFILEDTASIKSAIIKEDVFRHRQNHWAQNGSGIDPGELMRAFLGVMCQRQAIDVPETERLTAKTEAKAIKNTEERVATNNRSELRESSKQMESHVVGDEGPTLLESGYFWMPGPRVAPVLQDWMAKAETPQTLWVAGPAVSETVSMTSPKSAALNVVLAAWRVQSPMISHFCERPRRDADGLTGEQSGMIGLVYSLIMQLLQFEIEDDQQDLDPEDVSCLDGSIASFPKSLSILDRLYTHTPDIRFCVIHNLNALEWGGGAGWCHDFLDVLFQVQARCRASLRILFTTSGSSRVLAERIPARSQFYSEQVAQQIPLPGSRSS